MRQQERSPVVVPARRDSSRRAVLALCLFMLLGSWGLGALLGARLDRGREGTLRNPHSDRDWLRHVSSSPARREGERLIILISNSQGYGFAVPDDRTYAALLQERLAAEGGAVRVLNWSIRGGAGPEFVLLAAAAHRLDPSLVLALVTPGNFTESALTQRGLDLPLSGFASDAYQLAALPEVRAHLPKHFRSQYLDFPTRIDAYLARVSKLWRFRDMPVELMRPAWLERAEQRQRHKLRRGEAARRRRGRAAGRTGRPNQTGPNRTFVLAQPAGASDRPDPAAVRYDLLEDLLAATRDSSRFVLAWMPVRSSKPGSRARFIAKTGRMSTATGAELWDLRTAVPNWEFEDRVHLSASGHLRLAELLVDRLGP